MKKKVTISSEKITAKQWSVLLLELNIMKTASRPFAKLEVHGKEFKKEIKWGTRKYDEKEET